MESPGWSQRSDVVLTEILWSDLKHDVFKKPLKHLKALGKRGRGIKRSTSCVLSSEEGKRVVSMSK